MKTKLTIGLFGEAAAADYQPLFENLSRLFPVRFRSSRMTEDRDLDAAILFSKTGEVESKSMPAGVPAFIAVENPSRRVTVSKPSVRFGGSTGVDSCLRDQTMEDLELKEFCPLAPPPGHEVVASMEDQPLWTRRSSGKGTVDQVGVLPPAVGRNDYLCKFFRAVSFMRLLPLIVFLRQLTRPLDWEPPRRRACFIFDDPSLYWPSYGFLNFRDLAEHSLAHNYYVALATIPLDTWWMNPKVIKLFRDHAPRMSLLVHGNDHLKRELARPASSEETVRMLAQALRRFERLERCEGVVVSRIMEAPHGAIAEPIMRAVRQLDYEGALATAQLLIRYDPETVWPATLGFELTELLGGGLPVLPRIKMSNYWKNSVLLAAVLEQPIVLVGHHADAMGRLELLEQFAKTINRLEGITWATPRDIVRSNFKQRRDGDALHVQMYSRRIQLTVPEGVRSVWIHRPWLTERNGSEALQVTGNGRQAWSARNGNGVSGPIPATPREPLQIVSTVPNAIDHRVARPPQLRVWPVFRKMLMEVRDRTSPLRTRKPVDYAENWP